MDNSFGDIPLSLIILLLFLCAFTGLRNAYIAFVLIHQKEHRKLDKIIIVSIIHTADSLLVVCEGFSKIDILDAIASPSSSPVSVSVIVSDFETVIYAIYRTSALCELVGHSYKILPELFYFILNFFLVISHFFWSFFCNSQPETRLLHNSWHIPD